MVRLQIREMVVATICQVMQVRVEGRGEGQGRKGERKRRGEVGCNLSTLSVVREKSFLGFLAVDEGREERSGEEWKDMVRWKRERRERRRRSGREEGKEGKSEGRGKK